jgi:hypothetical protein
MQNIAVRSFRVSGLALSGGTAPKVPAGSLGLLELS